MDSFIECENCGEEYPPSACKHGCPACGLQGSRREKKVRHKYEDDDE